MNANDETLFKTTYNKHTVLTDAQISQSHGISAADREFHRAMAKEGSVAWLSARFAASRKLAK